VVVGMAIGLLTLGALGCVAGLLVGLQVHPATAVFAAVEIGLPSATVGAVVGLAVGALAQWVIASHQAEQGPVDDDFAGKPPGW
jgi:Na+/glutamate symporter